MDALTNYLNSRKPEDQADFAARCGTSVGYLRKAICVNQRLRESVCINIERESSGAVRCEDLRPDVDWAYLRATDCPIHEAA
jgi:DNA-binding transcriptional regulator YdaS (Cro superfamily)